MRARAILHASGAGLSRLSAREQRLLAVFFGLAVLAGGYLLVVEPLVTGRARMEQRVSNLQRDIVTMQALADRIRTLQSELGSSPSTDAAKDFSLFSFMDRAAAASMSRDAIASMNPSRRALRDGYEESSVELRVNGVTLPEMVALLQRIEEAEQPVYIKRLELKRRYDDKSRFDATVVAAATTRT